MGKWEEGTLHFTQQKSADSDSERLTLFKETGRSQEWLVLPCSGVGTIAAVAALAATLSRP